MKTTQVVFIESTGKSFGATGDYSVKVFARQRTRQSRSLTHARTPLAR